MPGDISQGYNRDFEKYATMVVDTIYPSKSIDEKLKKLGEEFVEFVGAASVHSDTENYQYEALEELGDVLLVLLHIKSMIDTDDMTLYDLLHDATRKARRRFLSKKVPEYKE